jgi:hypothetical protein
MPPSTRVAGTSGAIVLWVTRILSGVHRPGAEARPNNAAQTGAGKTLLFTTVAP